MVVEKIIENEKQLFYFGIDVGSTTVKIAVLDQNENLVYHRYQRHYSDSWKTLQDIIEDVHQEFRESTMKIAVTGSGGMSISEHLKIPFVQEVIAGSKAIQRYLPDTDVVIELGGEDAKITFYGNGVDQRMNGICAGGTGAFIDQMAILLKTDASGLNELAQDYRVIYPVAARCGVFAKTDIQPLLNEGARKEDIAASIFQAVVNQTIAGLACGRRIRGKVALLGGPAYFLPQLRIRFKETLKLKDEEIIVPDKSQIYVAIGAALASKKEEEVSLADLRSRFNMDRKKFLYETAKLEPLFADDKEYEKFVARHARNKVKRKDLKDFQGKAFLGMDVGSTTTKAALIDGEGNLLYSDYANNEGNPLESAVYMLKKLYNELPSQAEIVYSAVTGYGEDRKSVV